MEGEMEFIEEGSPKDLEPKEEASLVTMPPELVQTILKRVLDKDRLALRLVTHYLKDNVDDGYGLTLTLSKDLTPDRLDFFRSIVIREAFLNEMTNMNFPDLFTKPLSLETAVFNDKSPVAFFKDLLTTCYNLQNLYLYGTMDGLLDLSDRTFWIRLLHLRNLDLRMVHHDQTDMEVYNCSQNTLTILDHVLAPELLSICVELCSGGRRDSYAITDCIKRFLSRHKKLKKVFFCTRLRAEGTFYQDPLEEMYMLNDFNVKKMVKEMRLISKDIRLTTILITLNTVNDPWFAFLNEQTGLEKVGLCDTWGRTNWIALATFVLKRNWATLSTVYILASFRSIFDFSCLKDCAGLKELLLINTTEFDDDFAAGHFRNFSIAESCPRVDFIALSHIILTQEDLSQITALKSLRYLGLVHTGGVDVGLDVGIDFQFVKDALQMRSLEGLLIEGVRICENEMRELATLVELLRSPDQDDSQFYSLINIQDPEDERNRRWSATRPGEFIFDIDFFKDNYN